MEIKPQLECVIAQSPEMRDMVYRLRYECYRRDQSIEPRPDERFRDAFDEYPNSFSFLVYSNPMLPRENWEALATVRITVARDRHGWHDSPARHVFGDDPSLQAMAEAGFVEASRLCFARQARRDAFVKLVGNLAAHASFYDVPWLVACPRVEHSASYQRMFGFKPIGAPRQYYGVGFQTQLLAISREEIGHYVRDAKPMKAAWSTALEQITRSHGGSALCCAMSA
jgi:hypothetical protein